MVRRTRRAARSAVTACALAVAVGACSDGDSQRTGANTVADDGLPAITASVAALEPLPSSDELNELPSTNTDLGPLPSITVFESDEVVVTPPPTTAPSTSTTSPLPPLSTTTTTTTLVPPTTLPSPPPLPIPSDVLFDPGKSELRPEAISELLQFAEDLLATYPNVPMKVVGHTDSRNSDEENDRLSRQRAQAVVDFLVFVGFDPNNLSAEGRGESALLVDDMPNGKYEESLGRQNRRVELEFLNA